MRAVCLIALIAAALPAGANASETITYSYDAKGRLTTVARAGSVNDGQTTAYQFDAADNRTRLTVTGAKRRMIVVPLGGFTLIPIAQ